MANEGFNGTTISIGGTAQTPITNITHDDSAAEIDVTGGSDAMHSYEAGLPNPTTTFETVGISGNAVGDTGSLSIAWFDGTTDAISAVVVTKVSKSGGLDGALGSSVTVRPHSGVGTGS